MTSLGKPYYNTENDLVDGTVPMWGGTNAPGYNWPMSFLLNYIRANGKCDAPFPLALNGSF